MEQKPEQTVSDEEFSKVVNAAASAAMKVLCDAFPQIKRNVDAYQVEQEIAGAISDIAEEYV